MTSNTELGLGVTLEESLLMFEASRDGLCNRSALSKLHDPEAADGHELSRLVRVARPSSWSGDTRKGRGPLHDWLDEGTSHLHVKYRERPIPYRVDSLTFGCTSCQSAVTWLPYGYVAYYDIHELQDRVHTTYLQDNGRDETCRCTLSMLPGAHLVFAMLAERRAVTSEPYTRLSAVSAPFSISSGLLRLLYMWVVISSGGDRQ